MPNTLMILFTWCTVNFVFITWLLTRVLAHQREQYDCFKHTLEGLNANLKSSVSVYNRAGEIIDQLEELKKLHQPIIKSVPTPTNRMKKRPTPREN